MIEAWRETLLPEGSQLQDAARCLDHSGLQIVLVTGPGDRLAGTITDGDIRRAMLKGATLETPVSEILHASPVVAPPDLDLDAVEGLMQANKVNQLPVVDSNRRVVGLHIWSELQTPEVRDNWFVIMAGGEGIRLRPETNLTPKPMLPVGDKPMLEHIILRARQEGFRTFVIAVHYLGNVIEDYFGDGAKWGVNIRYLREDKPLGTGGALGLFETRPDAPFILTNGDVLTDVRYASILAFHDRHGADATMGVRLHQWQHPFGVVQTRGLDIVDIEEKPVHRTNVNAGIYALSPAVLDDMTPDEYCDMPTLFRRIQKRGLRAIAFPMHEHWVDVGRHDDLIHARARHSDAAQTKG